MTYLNDGATRNRHRAATGGGSIAGARGERGSSLSLSDRIHHLILLCYEAASADCGWSKFAAEFARSLSATRCAGIIQGGCGAGQTVLWAHGQPPCPSGAWFPPGFDQRSSQRSAEGIRTGATSHGRFLVGLSSAGSGPRCSVVAVRPADAPGFSDGEIALLGELLPHIDRALQVCRAIRHRENRRDALTEILDRLPEAIFLVDCLGTVILSNLTARAIAQQNDGLSLIDDRISIADPGEQDALRALIGKAARDTASSAGSPSGHAIGPRTMSVSRPSSRTALPIVVTPVRCRGVPDGRPAIVAAVITKDTEQRGSVLVPDLAIAFGLTRGEKRLAELVAGGLGLKEAAETLGITRNTVRTHMKRVYAKTGVHSQADLVRLLSRGSIELRLLEHDR